MTETEAKWSERIQQWKESGKKAAEFAAGQPYKATTLVWWATELRRRSGAGGAQSKGRPSPGKIRMARVVPVARRLTKLPARGLVVEVSGARIALERGFDAELLAEVVRAIGDRR